MIISPIQCYLYGVLKIINGCLGLFWIVSIFIIVGGGIGLFLWFTDSDCDLDLFNQSKFQKVSRIIKIIILVYVFMLFLYIVLPSGSTYIDMIALNNTYISEDMTEEEVEQTYKNNVKIITNILEGE